MFVTEIKNCRGEEMSPRGGEHDCHSDTAVIHIKGVSIGDLWFLASMSEYSAIPIHIPGFPTSPAAAAMDLRSVRIG